MMLGREQRTAEFPKGGIEVCDVEDIAGRVVDLDAITDTIGSFDENVDPADKARDRRLKSEAQHERDKPERNDRRVPVREQHGQYYEEDRDPAEQICDAIQVVARRRFLDP